MLPMTQDELIQRLGGAKTVAEKIGVAANVVGNWRMRGIASWALGRIERLCVAEGIDPGDALEPKQPRRTTEKAA